MKMKNISIILMKELNATYRSPLSYVLLGLFALISNWVFFNLLVGYIDTIQAIPGQYTQGVSFIQEVVLRFFANLNFLFIFFIPLVTMRVFSDEMKQGTMDLLLASPVNDIEILLGKWLGSVIFVLTIISLSLINLYVLFWTGLDDIPLIMSAYLGLSLNAICYVSVGIFASSLTQNSMIAAMTSFVIIFLTWLLAWMGTMTSNFYVAEFLGYLSLTAHFEQLMRGVVGTTDLVYYSSFIFFMLFLCRKSLDTRNW